jgi:hypothetical protein
MSGRKFIVGFFTCSADVRSRHPLRQRLLRSYRDMAGVILHFRTPADKVNEKGIVYAKHRGTMISY